MRQISNCWVDIEKGYRQALLHEFNLKKRYSNIIQSIERKRVLELESIMLSSKLEQEEKRRRNTQKLTPLFLIGSGSILFSLFVLIFIGLIYHIQENNPIFRILLGSLFLIFIGIFIFGLFFCAITFVFLLGNLRNEFSLRDNNAIFSIPSFNVSELWLNDLCNYDEPVKRKTTGSVGEKLLLDSLAKVLPDTFFVLSNVLVCKSLDVDLLLIGPSGIFILESKYWTGVCKYLNGIWEHYREYRDAKGNSDKHILPVGYPPDKEWLSQKTNVMESIIAKLKIDPGHVETIMDGGLVFTNPNVKLEISGCPVLFGNIQAWINRISLSRKSLVLSTDMVYKLMDAVLEKANKLSDTKTLSGYDLANHIYDQQTKLIESFILQHMEKELTFERKLPEGQKVAINF